MVRGIHIYQADLVIIKAWGSLGTLIFLDKILFPWLGPKLLPNQAPVYPVAYPSHPLQDPSAPAHWVSLVPEHTPLFTV